MAHNHNDQKGDEEKTNNKSTEEATSYQLVHMKLGHVILGIVITLPRNELPKFKENDNKLYKELLGLINGKLSQILQREQNRKHQKKSKSRSKNKGRYQIITGKSVKFACALEEKQSNYCFVEDLLPKSDPNPSFNDCVVSPLCLSVHAVTIDGFLPFTESGDVIISQFFQTDNSNNSNNR
eukprot:332282_1